MFKKILPELMRRDILLFFEILNFAVSIYILVHLENELMYGMRNNVTAFSTWATYFRIL